MAEVYLKKIYYNPFHPASYSGPSKLYKAARADGKKITLQKIRQWLKGQETYTLHRRARYKFPHNRVVVSGIDTQWDVDLMDMSNVAQENDGVHFVLVAIDIFSRYTWLEPLKTKHGKSVINAFSKIFAQGRQPYKMRSDKGTEFTGRLVQKYLKDQGVDHFVTQNQVKANYAERVIKTIKGRIYKYFTKKQTHRYIDHLQDFVRSYNHTYHRSIKTNPADVTKENEAAQVMLQYGQPLKQMKIKSFKFDVGDHIRISYLRTTFMREYHEKWTTEIFTVSSRRMRAGIPVYTLKDYGGEDITGTFYQDELQLIDMPEVFRIEKTLRKRKVKGEKQHLVRWAGWPPKYDSWIDAKDLQEYQKS